MNNSSIRSMPTFARPGIVNMIVLNIILKNLAFFINLNILPILNALAIVAYLGPILAEEV